MSDAITLTPPRPAAIGVPKEDGRPEPGDWLVRECRAIRAATEEIAILMTAHARAQDEIKRLNGRIESLAR